ncbi:hypothetical protein [Microbacterium xylanilyticum]
MDLVGGWNRIWGNLVPQGLQIVMTVVGVGIIVIFIGLWLWQKRKAGVSGVATGFPGMATFFGCLLAGPNVILPVALLIIQGILGIVVAVLAWGATFL